jgi:hypothetical protein
MATVRTAARHPQREGDTEENSNAKTSSSSSLSLLRFYFRPYCPPVPAMGGGGTQPYGFSRRVGWSLQNSLEAVRLVARRDPPPLPEFRPTANGAEIHFKWDAEPGAFPRLSLQRGLPWRVCR